MGSGKIAIITSCSKNKLPGRAKAGELYQGQFFSSIKQIAINLSADLYILSAKYGLISANTEIESYDQRIKTKADIKRLFNISKGLFEENLQKYTLILLIMGRDYQSVFDSFISPKILRSSDHRGSGGYLQLASELKALSLKNFLQYLDYLQKHNLVISVLSLATFFTEEKPKKKLIQTHILPVTIQKKE